jgi:hypothetical protein
VATQGLHALGLDIKAPVCQQLCVAKFFISQAVTPDLYERGGSYQMSHPETRYQLNEILQYLGKCIDVEYYGTCHGLGKIGVVHPPKSHLVSAHCVGISLLTVSLASFWACWLGDKLTSSNKVRNEDFTRL